MKEVEEVVAALRAGRPVLLPTDTVYGLCSLPTEPAVRALYELKGRAGERPTALLAAGVDALLELVPELRGRMEVALRALLPASLTVIVDNPARRLPWLTGDREETIGVRVPTLPPATAAALSNVGPVAATSANEPGMTDPGRLADVPLPIRRGCAAELDAGELPGAPSTVVDLTGPEPIILREGAVPAAQALALARGAGG